RGVKGDAGTIQVEDVGDAVGEHAECVAGGKMTIRNCLIAVERVRVIILRRTNKNADLSAGNRGGTNAGVFKRLPSQLQQNPLLRIHLLRLARRDAEYAGVESPDVIEHAGSPGVAFTALAAPRMSITCEREAIGRQLRDGAAPLEQQRPQFGD